MTINKAYLLIEKWFGQNHPLQTQMLAMLLDDTSEGELLHDIDFQKELESEEDERDAYWEEQLEVAAKDAADEYWDQF